MKISKIKGENRTRADIGFALPFDAEYYIEVAPGFFQNYFYIHFKVAG